jgi:hypothetical protein
MYAYSDPTVVVSMLSYTVRVVSIVSAKAIVLGYYSNQRVANKFLPIFCPTFIYVQTLLDLTSAPEPKAAHAVRVPQTTHT